MSETTSDLPDRFPPPTRRLKLGVVGGGLGGLVGEFHANGARLSNRWDIVAGALSSDPERAKISGKAWLLADDRVYADYREMATKEAARPDGIDAVAIATPNHLHYPVACAFMDAGIDVICDKPVTTTHADAIDLVRKQRQTGVVFGVTYAYGSHAMMRQARAMIRNGKIGEIRQIHVEYFQEWAIDLTDEGKTAIPWRLDKNKGGATFTVADIGTHAEYLACFVTGKKLTAVQANFHVTGQPKSLEDTAFMHLRFEGGI
ncbi:MAG: Gfo/Idh/MocA family protein, partial [Halocynthiibacter sp.]